jgi:hypothetical protein
MFFSLSAETRSTIWHNHTDYCNHIGVIGLIGLFMIKGPFTITSFLLRLDARLDAEFVHRPYQHTNVVTEDPAKNLVYLSHFAL